MHGMTIYRPNFCTCMYTCQDIMWDDLVFWLYLARIITHAHYWLRLRSGQMYGEYLITKVTGLKQTLCVGEDSRGETEF